MQSWGYVRQGARAAQLLNSGACLSGLEIRSLSRSIPPEVDLAFLPDQEGELGLGSRPLVDRVGAEGVQHIAAPSMTKVLPASAIQRNQRAIWYLTSRKANLDNTRANSSEAVESETVETLVIASDAPTRL